MTTVLHITLFLCSAALVAGHGRVTAPPSRASAWRYGFPGPKDYDDTAQNCGGFDVQWKKNGGKCGLCGDAFDHPSPRPHELGGTFGVGTVVARYQPGATIDVTTDLTMSHQGYWEYKLCTDPKGGQECFDKHVLQLESGGTKYYPTRGTTIYTVKYKLPPGVTCDHCVLQWTYTAGNNWGQCGDGKSRLGCGPQEQFRECSDIAIGGKKSYKEGLGKDVWESKVDLDVDNYLRE